MAITARTWVEGEVATAAKFNTIRDDLLELDAVAGFFNAQYGTVIFAEGQNVVDVSVSTMSVRAILHNLGVRGVNSSSDIGATLSKFSATVVRGRRASTNGDMVVEFAISDPRG